jgi:hypothetical protein
MVASHLHRKTKTTRNATGLVCSKGELMKRLEILACFTKTLLVLAGSLACSVAFAQSTTQLCLGSESAVTFTISIVGADLDEIKNVSVHLSRPGKPNPDQSGFATDFGSDKSKNVGPGVFEVSAVTQKYQADGSYSIDSISITNGPIAASYSPPNFTAPPAAVVCNPKHFGPFTIKSVTKKT